MEIAIVCCLFTIASLMITRFNSDTFNYVMSTFITCISVWVYWAGLVSGGYL